MRKMVIGRSAANDLQYGKRENFRNLLEEPVQPSEDKTKEKNDAIDHRPWGYYEILSDAADCKVKRITVYPEKRLSLQRHFHRSEHWYLISGTAVVTRNGEETRLGRGDAIDLPVRAWHRIRNVGSENVVFIEVQTGDYFGEDDIERSEDDYGRA